MKQCKLCSFYFRWLPVYSTRYDLYILCYQQYRMIPCTKGQSTFHLIRYVRTRYMHRMWLIHPYVTPRPRHFDIRSLSSEYSVGLLDRAHIYAATIRVPWRAIPYEYVFRSSTTYTLGTILLVCVCVVAHVVPHTTQWGIYGCTHWQPILTGAKHR